MRISLQNKLIIIVASLFFLLSLIFLIQFLLKSQKNVNVNVNEKGTSDKILTTEEKIDILSEVSTTTPVSTSTMSEKQKQAILQQVDKTKKAVSNQSATKNSTEDAIYEAKMKILNSTQ